MQREGCEDKGRKPALNVSQTKLEETERCKGEPGQMEAPSITEDKPMTEVRMFNSPIASRSMRMHAHLKKCVYMSLRNPGVMSLPPSLVACLHRIISLKIRSFNHLWF